jgi:hypothetical protein
MVLWTVGTVPTYISLNFRLPMVWNRNLGGCVDFLLTQYRYDDKKGMLLQMKRHKVCTAFPLLSLLNNSNLYHQWCSEDMKLEYTWHCIHAVTINIIPSSDIFMCSRDSFLLHCFSPADHKRGHKTNISSCSLNQHSSLVWQVLIHTALLLWRLP